MKIKLITLGGWEMLFVYDWFSDHLVWQLKLLRNKSFKNASYLSASPISAVWPSGGRQGCEVHDALGLQETGTACMTWPHMTIVHSFIVVQIYKWISLSVGVTGWGNELLYTIVYWGPIAMSWSEAHHNLYHEKFKNLPSSPSRQRCLDLYWPLGLGQNCTCNSWRWARFPVMVRQKVDLHCTVTVDTSRKYRHPGVDTDERLML